MIVILRFFQGCKYEHTSILQMLSVSQGMEVGSSGRGASAEDDPTAGAVSGGVGGGGGGNGDDTRRRRDIQAVMIAAARDRAIRTESVRHDLALNLPPRLELPDGEEHPYGAHPDLHLRNPEQVREKRGELKRLATFK